MSQKYDFFLSDGLNKDWSDYGSELHLARPSAQNHPHWWGAALRKLHSSLIFLPDLHNLFSEALKQQIAYKWSPSRICIKLFL